ncbi:MAG TPA: MlaD family protein [Polyangiaceae bacterium]|jgi:phospholipid/cholesterol/gamma-HCH transport system substrate-binding protein|nr:MlaD family protein [Polyangiaceae bacterium]
MRLSRATTAAKVGVFAVVLFGAGFFIYRFVNKSSGAGRGYVVYALLRDAAGIAKHSQVRMAGIPVGSIAGIRLEGDKARIDVRMDPEVPLYEDASVTKVASSLLGEYYLAVGAGTEGKRQLKEGDRIMLVIEATSTDQLIRELADIARDVKQVTSSLAQSVGTDQGRDDIKKTLKNLAEVTEALNQTVRENRQSVRDILVQVDNITKNGGPQIEKILENVRQTTQEIRELTAKAEGGKPETAGEIRQIVEKVNRASNSLESALKNIDSVTGRLDRGEGTLGRLSKDEKLINEVEGVAENVGDFIGGISRIQTMVGLRTDYQFLGNGVKSYVELRLQPSEDKYYLIEVINDPHGLTRYEQVDIDTTNPNSPPHYREIHTVTSNQLRFSLQFAQSIGPFTGRWGIKESTGGIGLDLLLFEKRFELRQDLFGFGEVVLPRWRVSLGYEFINRLWLLGGVDDMLSGSRRDYFVGAQLRFNDEDLKRIIPFVPAQ